MSEPSFEKLYGSSPGQLTESEQALREQVATLTAERDAERAERISYNEEVTYCYEKLAAAEKVCEAAARLADTIYPESVFDGSSGDPGPLAVVALRDALTDWRRTKESK